MVFCIKLIFYFKHTILKLCWANSHQVVSMILTSRYIILCTNLPPINLVSICHINSSSHVFEKISSCISGLILLAGIATHIVNYGHNVISTRIVRGELEESNLYRYLLSKTESNSGNAVISRHFEMNSSIMIPNNTRSSIKFLSGSDLISKLHATCALISLQSRFRMERSPPILQQ